MMVENINSNSKNIWNHLNSISITIRENVNVYLYFHIKEHSLTVVVKQNNIEENDIMIVIYNRH